MGMKRWRRRPEHTMSITRDEGIIHSLFAIKCSTERQNAKDTESKKIQYTQLHTH